MKYEHIVKGQFLERPNRFVARVRIEDREETVHVKNTGRCRELLQRDAVVYLEKCGGAKDRTGGQQPGELPPMTWLRWKKGIV